MIMMFACVLCGDSSINYGNGYGKDDNDIYMIDENNMQELCRILGDGMLVVYLKVFTVKLALRQFNNRHFQASGGTPNANTAGLIFLDLKSQAQVGSWKLWKVQLDKLWSLICSVLSEPSSGTLRYTWSYNSYIKIQEPSEICHDNVY